MKRLNFGQADNDLQALIIFFVNLLSAFILT